VKKNSVGFESESSLRTTPSQVLLSVSIVAHSGKGAALDVDVDVTVMMGVVVMTRTFSIGSWS